MAISTTLQAEPGVSARKASQPKIENLSVKMPVDVLDTARVVAALRGETITDVLANILRPALAKLEREELAKRAKRTAEA